MSLKKNPLETWDYKINKWPQIKEETVILGIEDI